MRNVLYVKLSATNSVATPGANIRFVRATSATVVEYYYIGDDGGPGSVNLTVTSGYADVVIKALCVLAATGTGVCHIGDETTSSYFHPKVEGIAGLTASA
tara:strand:- start:93 stop:392 length:300 start_codon:yes stop_codon:yes gene_type:complete